MSSHGAFEWISKRKTPPLRAENHRRSDNQVRQVRAVDLQPVRVISGSRSFECEQRLQKEVNSPLLLTCVSMMGGRPVPFRQHQANTRRWFLSFVVVVLVLVANRDTTRVGHAMSVSHVVGPCDKGCTSGSADADIVIGALMDVHDWNDSTSTCTERPTRVGPAWQWAESMRFAVEQINNIPDLLPGLTLGYDMRDTCSNAQQAKQLTVEFLSSGVQTETCSAANETDSFSPLKNVDESGSSPMPIPAVIGPFSSSETVEIARLTALFQMPLVSFSASNPDLGNRCKYPFFTRTLPSDAEEIFLAVELAAQLGFTYVSFIYSSNTYGTEAFRAFKSIAERKGICLAAEIKLSMTQKHPAYYRQAVEKLLRNTTDEPYVNARLAMVFASDQAVYPFLRAAMKVAPRFAGRNWVIHARAVNLFLQHFDILRFMVGSFSIVAVNTFNEPTFENRVNTLISNNENITAVSSLPWVIEAFASDEQLRYNIITAASTNPFSSYLREAVFALAHALNTTITDLCVEQFKVMCSENELRTFIDDHRRKNRRIDGVRLQQEIESVFFTSPITQKPFQLESVTRERLNTPFSILTSALTGPDPKNPFQVLYGGIGWTEYMPEEAATEKIKRMGPTSSSKKFCASDDLGMFAKLAKPVVYFGAGMTNISKGLEQKKLDGKPFESVCAKPCSGGTEPSSLKSGHAPRCCWTCHRCKKNHFSPGNNKPCKSCPENAEASERRDGCVLLKIRKWDTGRSEAVALLALALAVLVMVIALGMVTFTIQYQYRNQVKVLPKNEIVLPKWPLGSLGLTATSLTGCLLFPLVAMATITEPSTVMCSTIVVTFYSAFMLIALSVLTNAIQRHFQRRQEFGLRQPSFLSSQWSSTDSENVDVMSMSQRRDSRLCFQEGTSAAAVASASRKPEPGLRQSVMFRTIDEHDYGEDYRGEDDHLEKAQSSNSQSVSPPKPARLFSKTSLMSLTWRRISRRDAFTKSSSRSEPFLKNKQTLVAVFLAASLSILLISMGVAVSPVKSVYKVYPHTLHVEYCDADVDTFVAASIAPILIYIGALVISARVVWSVKKRKMKLRSEDIASLVFLLLWFFMYVVMTVIQASSPSDYLTTKLWAVTGRHCFAMLLVVLAMNTIIHIPPLASHWMKSDDDSGLVSSAIKVAHT